MKYRSRWSLLTLTLVIFFSLSSNISVASAAEVPLAGRTIALDAGHGNGDPGATGYCNGVPVNESEVNLRTREALQQKLEAAGAAVFLVPQPVSRRDRVAAAEAAGSDIIVSIHHNGSSDTTLNYTKSFVTQKNDKQLASFIHPELLAQLGLPDAGVKSDGYGMTVYGRLPGVLTEAYFITNTAEACDFLSGQSGIEAEAQAHYDGIIAYFADQDSGGNGNGNGRGPKPK